MGVALTSFSVNAAGLGKLSVFSALGEPLKAEIEVLEANAQELSALSASLASFEAYQAQGIAHAAIHSSVALELGKKSNGTPIIKVKTMQPVTDPFLDLLVQLDWATGRLQREYTVLLDPPGYKQEDSADVTPASSELTVPQTEKQALASNIPLPKTTPVTATKQVATIKTEDSTDAYRTQRGDTLLKIARESQVDGYNLDQMLIGLYRANKDAFVDENINKLRVGRIIKVPDAQILSEISEKEAANEVKVHTRNWKRYSENLAKTATTSTKQNDAGDGHAENGKIAAAQEQGNKATGDVVRLSSGIDDKKVGSAATSQSEKTNALQEELIAKNKEVRDSHEKVAMLEKQLSDMQKLLTLKNKTLAEAQENAGKAKSEPEPVKPEPVKPALAETEVEGGFHVMSLLGNTDPVLLGGTSGAIALLGGSWLWLRNRRKKSISDFERGIVTSGGLKGTTVFGSTVGATIDTADTSFFTDFSRSTDGAVVDGNDVDPIAEAEVYMAYGREAQAEEILKDAIVKEPTRYELHLKLLEMLSARNDTAEFETIAGELYTTIGAEHPIWARVAEIGRKMEPDNPLYNSADSLVAIASDNQRNVDSENLINNTDDTISSHNASVDDVEAMSQNIETANNASESALEFDLTGVVKVDAVATQGSVDENTLSFDVNDFKLNEPRDVMENVTSSNESTIDISDQIMALDGLDLPTLDFDNTVAENVNSVEQELPSIDMALDDGDALELDVSDVTSDLLNQPDSLSNETVLDFSNVDLDITNEDKNASTEDQNSPEVETKLDLGIAYLDMGDKEGARELLEEVVKEGSLNQRERAVKLLEKV